MKNIYRSIIGFLAAIIMVSGIIAFPKDADAIPVVEIGANLIQSIISAVHDIDIGLKEFVLDGLAKSVANAVATQMKNSIVNWINSGFEGSPAFVTDLKGFLLDIGDTVAADYIQTLDSETQSLICSPFRANIKYSLTIEYYSSTSGRPLDRCSLDEIFDNVDRLDRFLTGSFSEGGWEGWFNLAVKPHNNPYGSYLQARDELYTNISGAKQRQKTELEWANGFLSKKICDDKGVFSYERDYGGQVQGGNSGYQTVTEGADAGCIIVTPGKAIEDTLSDVLGSDLRDLELADEFNEIVSALVAQLAKEVITGAGGLLGTSKPQAGTRQSFLDRVAAAQQTQSQAATGSTATQRITQAIGNENQYRSLKLDSQSRVAEADTALKALEACLATKSPLDPLFSESFAFAAATRNAINAASITLNADIKSADAALLTLADLEKDAKAATTQAAYQNILTTLQTLEANNTVHDGQDVVAATRENTDIAQKMGNATTEANTRRISCAL